jgi:hypothetical protein
MAGRIDDPGEWLIVGADMAEEQGALRLADVMRYLADEYSVSESDVSFLGAIGYREAFEEDLSKALVDLWISMGLSPDYDEFDFEFQWDDEMFHSYRREAALIVSEEFGIPIKELVYTRGIGESNLVGDAEVFDVPGVGDLIPRVRRPDQGGELSPSDVLLFNRVLDGMGLWKVMFDEMKERK